MISSIWYAGVCTQATCLHSVGVARPTLLIVPLILWFVVNKGAKRINTYITMTSILCSFSRVCFVCVSFELQLHQHVALIITWQHSLSRSRWFDVLHQYQRVSMNSQMVFFHVATKNYHRKHQLQCDYNSLTLNDVTHWLSTFRILGKCWVHTMPSFGEDMRLQICPPCKLAAAYRLNWLNIMNEVPKRSQKDIPFGQNHKGCNKFWVNAWLRSITSHPMKHMYSNCSKYGQIFAPSWATSRSFISRGSIQSSASFGMT